jgi:ABC-type phosphate transport system permease subunit
LLALAAAMGEMVAIYWVLTASGTVTPSLYNSPITILNPFVNAQTLSILMETTYVGTKDSTASPGPGVYAVGFILFVIIGVVNIAARTIIARRSNTVSE